MKYRTRIQYTETDKVRMWDRWRPGESLHAIARLFDRHHSSVSGILSRTGGIRPPPRRRSSLVLALAEREEISRGVMVGRSVRTIGRSLGRGAVSAQITLNAGRRELDAVLMEHAAPIIELTATLCEDHATCMIVVELADSTLLGRSVDWPSLVPFSEADVLAELQRLDPSRCVH